MIGTAIQTRNASADAADREALRLASLRSLDILDTDPEPAFDAIARIAALATGSPIGLISLVDSERQWFKARHGLDATETPRNISFCTHAVEHDAPLVVPSSEADPRFAETPLATGAPYVRAYLGAPIRDRNGLPLGTVCAIDNRAREWTDEQLAQLTNLATLVGEMLKQRAALRSARSSTMELAEMAEESLRERRQLASVLGASRAGSWVWTLSSGHVAYDARWAEILGYRLDQVEQHISFSSRLAHPDDLAECRRRIQEHLDGRTPSYEVEMRLRHASGDWIWVLGHGVITSRNAAGQPETLTGTMLDVSLHRQMMAELKSYRSRMERDLAAARRMQMSLLEPPETLLEIGEASSCRISAMYEPSDAVGGDLWGIARRSSGGFGVYLTDISGHGVTAAINAFRFHQLAKRTPVGSRPLPMWLSEINFDLFMLLPVEQFATCVAGIYEPERNTFSYATAGAPAPLIYRAAERRFAPGSGETPPLGVMVNPRYGVHALKVSPGDAVLIYSDALFEDIADVDRCMSLDDLADIATGVMNTPSDTPFLQRLRTELGREGRQEDDLTAVFIEFGTDAAS